MRVRAVALATLASVSIVGIGWQLGSQAIDASQSLTAAADTGASAAATAATETAATASAHSGTFTGSVVQTQYGNVQVSVTVANGAITEVTPLQLTNRGGRSVGISNQAAPILRSEVLAAQSAKVKNVSGATYTSEGYRRSLQSALDTAGF
ncbi:FMN-binding protein [Cryobacterium ruanii]|uniref:FMN-binding protein n=1 Tax=Cryobacterium ruanii TaxID=1259197 RepID=A0A4R9AP29_9MICO|nr:FMN-binding protein [Cryobacterium ruanii]TFD66832.1 FMN-binding protein [Cryobacterium ruanii]